MPKKSKKDSSPYVEVVLRVPAKLKIGALSDMAFAIGMRATPIRIQGGIVMALEPISMEVRRGTEKT